MNACEVLLLLLGQGSFRSDVVTLKSGDQLECLVVSVDDRQVRLRRGMDGISETRELPRADVVDIRLSTPEVSGFRSIAKRFEGSRWTREAADAWREVCVLRPEGVSDLLKLSQVCRRAGRFEEAAAAAGTAEKADPRDPRVPLEEAEIALATGDGPSAVKFARVHLRLGTADSPEGRWALGRGLEAAGLAEDALLEYRELLRTNPETGDLPDRYVDLSLSQKKGEEAVPEVERFARRSPDRRSGWIALGKLLYRLERFQEAELVLRKATSLGGSDYSRARVYFQCTIARRYGRDPRGALSAEDLRLAADLDPTLRRESP